MLSTFYPFSGLEQEVARLKEENVNLKRELERTKDEKRTLETQVIIYYILNIVKVAQKKE